MSNLNQVISVYTLKDLEEAQIMSFSKTYISGIFAAFPFLLSMLETTNDAHLKSYFTQRQWRMIPHAANFSCVSHGIASVTI
jgi:hypothetical protein